MRPLVGILAGVLCALSFGRTAGPAVSGVVSSREGSRRAGVFVSARNIATGQTTYTMTRTGGRYLIRELPAGVYDVKVDDRAWSGPAQQVDLSITHSAKVDFVVSANAV